tara:strand:- start:1761 stop:2213 length:453 start_codon:yes stop_codon:yes gene_type:complete
MIFLILILITVLYIFLIVRYFSFFLNFLNNILLIILGIFLSATLMLYFTANLNFLAIILQLGIFVSFRIHSNIFYLESPTLFLSKIIENTKNPNKTNIKKKFLKHTFINYYLKILTKQKLIKKNKNYYIISKKGTLFFKFYEKLFNILIK